MTRLPGLWIGGGLAAGIAAAVAAPVGAGWVAAPAVLAALVVAAGAALPQSRPLLTLACAACLAGIARGELARPDPLAREAARQLAGAHVSLTGRVAEDPRPAGAGEELVVEPDRARTDAGAAVPGKLAVRLRTPSSAAEGDRVRIAGVLRIPARSPAFDRGAYLEQKGAYLDVSPASLQVLEPAPVPGGLLPSVRGWYRERVSAAVPEPHAAVLMGVVLGIRSGIPPRLRQALIDTGLVHLLVLSGLKVAVFARLALAVARPLLGRYAVWPAVGLVAAYAATGGATAAAARAAAMGGLALAGEFLGRPAQVWNSLAVVAAALLAWKPDFAMDPGFQLSFAGTAAIVLLAPAIGRRIAFLPRAVAEPLAVTCAAQLGTVPMTAGDFHVLSPIGPIANALTLPLLPAIVAGGLLLAPASIFPPAAGALGALLAGLLEYVEAVAQALDRVPGASVTVSDLPFAAGAGYFAAAAGAIVAWRAPGRFRMPAAAAAFMVPLVCAGAGLALAARPSDSATFLDTGGDALLIRAAGATVLVGAGGDPARMRGEMGARLPPWTRHIDAVVLTATAPAQSGGLEGFPYSVDDVFVSAAAGGAPAAAERLRASGARVHALAAGEVVAVGGLRIEALSPERADADPGSAALAIRIARPGGRAACEFGDLDAGAQLAAAERASGRCDYLLLPARSAGSELARRLHPEVVVVTTAGPARAVPGIPPAALRRTAGEGAIELPF